MGNSVSAIHQAAMDGDISKLRVAVQEQSQRINDPEPTRGWTALHITAIKGYDIMSRELLARGASPNITDKDGRSPLHLAAEKGHLQVVQDLLRKRADPTLRDKDGKTALDLAVAGEHVRVVALLRDATALLGISPGVSPTAQQAAAQAQLGPYGYPAVPGSVGGAGGAQAYGADASLNLPSAPPASPGYLDYITGTPGMYPTPAYEASYTPTAAAAGNQGAAYGQPGSAYPQAYVHEAGAGGYGAAQPAGAYPSAYPTMDGYAAGLGPGAYSVPDGGGGTYGRGGVETYPQLGVAQPAAQAPIGALPTWPPRAQAAQQPTIPTPQAAASAAPVPAAAAAAAAAPHQQQRPQAAPLEDEEDEDGWGDSSLQADWGQKSTKVPLPSGGQAGPALGQPLPYQQQASSMPPGARPAEPGPQSAQAAASMSAQAAAAEAARQRLEKLDLGAAVGGAVSKAAGAIGGAAVAGALHILGGILNAGKPQGQSGSQDGGRPGDQQGGRAQQQVQAAGSTGAANVSGASGASGATSALSGASNRCYTYEELYNATQGFCEANKLGSGGYGPVYKGVLDGVPVAIKCLDTSEGAMQGEKEFLKEAHILGRLHHPHIVLLIGICPATCMLVYELMDHGNLEEHILGVNHGDLLWQDRVRITAEVASALLFLHSAPEPIIHLDLKPANILLSRTLTSKIGDVGLSRLAPSLAPGALGGASTVMDTRLVGTPSFMDPEYLRTGRFGPKSDIFSLGVVMMQLLTGKDARSVITIVEAALRKSLNDPASFAAIIDPRAGPWPLVEAASFAHLAARCAALSRSDRPDLKSEVLPGLLQLAERAALYRPVPSPVGAPGYKRLASMNSSGAEPPSTFVCPITQEIMLDPVVASDGFTYEREAIAGWIASHNTSPMTNLPLESSHLTPNRTLRTMIKDWMEQHPEYAAASAAAIAGLQLVR